MKTNTLKKITFTLFFLITVTLVNALTVRYVTVSGAGSNDGTSWENAAIGTAVGIQAQIAAASTDQTGGEIRFGAGTYNLTATIIAVNGVDLIGAYPASPVTGSNESRNMATNQTIFDGGDAIKLIGIDETATYYDITLLDGLILQRARTTSGYGSAATVCFGFVFQNCIIRNNTGAGTAASYSGSAIHVRKVANVQVSTATNAANSVGVAFINCLIVNNTSSKGAGAINSETKTPLAVINCVIANNIALDNTPIQTNSTTVANGSDGVATGGIHLNNYGQSSKIINNIFYNNSSTKPMYNHMSSYSYIGNAFNNWFDGDQAWYDANQVVAVGFSPTNYMKNFTANGNKRQSDFTASSIFVAPNSILGSSGVQADIAAINSSDWRLKAGSGCIDAGTVAADIAIPYNIVPSGTTRLYSTVTTDLIGNNRISGLKPDMGAYETVSDANGIKQVVESGLVLSIGKNIQFLNNFNSVEIYNSVGSKICGLNNISTGSSITIEKNGIYMIRVKLANEIKVQKIIVL